MLSSELKASKDLRDLERYDTLCDVNMSCMAAVDILNDLLCYEKLDSGILILHKENVIISHFLKDCVSMFAAQARECGVTMSIQSNININADHIDMSADMTTPLPLRSDDSIFVDKFKMDQVIRNLISNALKFTPRGGAMTVTANFVPRKNDVSDLMVSNQGSTRLFCSSSSSAPRVNSSANSTAYPIDGHLVVVVTDTGAGISMENQKRLFKDIVQFSPEKLQAGGGSGLGLWISSGIVDLHEGRISVRSDGEGMGSSFTVEIPMLRSCEGTLQEQYSIKNGEEVRGARNAHSVGSHKDSFISFPLSSYCSLSGAATPTDDMSTRGVSFDVLVVDDSRLNRKMLMKFLQKGGHRCTEAEDGLEAIEVVKERIDFSNGGRGKPYDAILMDFIMPNMDGPTAVKEIRSMGYVAPIFGLTGNGRTLISLSCHVLQISLLVFFRCNISNIQFAENINERKCSSGDSSLA